MPSATTGMPRTKFGTIEFPSEMTRRTLVGRHFVHEYPHTPGGAPEKLGRGLWHVTVEANFTATSPLYPDLYPNGMTTISRWAELQTTLPFTHPSAGTFPAFIIHYDQTKNAKLKSGEKATIEFLEDQAQMFNATDLVVSADDTTIGPTALTLRTELAAVQAQLQVTPTDFSVFDALQTAVNTLLGFRDTTELWGNRYAAAAQQVISLCEQVDHMASMQDARAWPVVDSLRDLQAQAIRIQQDSQAKRQRLQRYVVPSTMSITQIATNLYQDASRQSDLLALNVINNPMSILAGTIILYYPNTAQQQAANAA